MGKRNSARVWVDLPVFVHRERQTRERETRACMWAGAPTVRGGSRSLGGLAQNWHPTPKTQSPQRAADHDHDQSGSGRIQAREFWGRRARTDALSIHRATMVLGSPGALRCGTLVVQAGAGSAVLAAGRELH